MPGRENNSDGSSSEVVDIQAVTVTLIDRSGTITLGGQAQPLAPANPLRKGHRLMNLSNGDLWLNDKGGTAAASQPSLKIASGVLYESPPNGVSGAALSIYGGTTAQAFESCEW